MHLCLGLLFLTLAVPASQAQCGPQCDMIDGARAVLFNGLSTLPRKGYWRRLVTFKDTAQVVLTGATVEDGIMAVASLDAGRVVVVGQDRHVQNFGANERNNDISQFHTNLETYLRNGDSGTWLIGNPSDSSQLQTYLADSNYKTIVSNGDTWATDSDDVALESWVRGGGTFVIGFDYLEFTNSFSGSAKHINFYQTVLSAGVAFERDAVSLSTTFSTSVVSVPGIVDMNFHNVISGLTWENFENNARLNHILEMVEDNERFFPHEVASRLLAPLVPFAEAMEANMIWPEAVAPDDGSQVAVQDRDHAMYYLYHILSIAQLWKGKAPSVDKFPGDVPNPPAPQQASFSFQSRKHRYFFSTGFYLVANQTMTITINNAPGDESWSNFILYCGASTDSLLYKRYTLARMPVVSRQMQLVDREATFRWPYGGLIYFKSPNGVGSNLDITIGGVIPTPHLDIIHDQNFDATWSSRCQSAGLTADIQGDYVRFTLPTDGGICEMSGQTVADIMAQWDLIVKKVDQLHGTELTAPVEDYQQQSFTFDLQTSLGALHSGFPIVAKVDYGYSSSNTFYMNGDWTTMWGPFHETGHNYDHKYMVYPDVSESTPNIASYFCMKRMTTQDWFNLTKIQNVLARDKLTDWLTDPSFTSPHYDAWNRFLVYSQSIRDFGWSCTRDVVKSYLDDEALGNPLPSTTDEKINAWVVRFSQRVGYNLAPLYDTFWKWPLSAATLTAIADLPPYFPDDPISQMGAASTLTASVLNSWPNLVRTVDVSTLPCNFFDIEEYV